MKNRLDKLLVAQGLAPSRERAQALIIAGRVLVDQQKVEKPGSTVEETSVLRILGEEQRYVSRGGIKLETALERWQIDLSGRICADIGTSTGGFTDCMLQHGAAGVVAVDTGYGQIAESLRRDARVALLERTNARYLKPGDLPPNITFVSMDVSFISATLVLPAVVHAVGESLREAVILVKPQFEAGREHVGAGGIVRDLAAHRFAVERVRVAVAALGALRTELADSPVATENREFLLYARF